MQLEVNKTDLKTVKKQFRVFFVFSPTLLFLDLFVTFQSFNLLSFPLRLLAFYFRVLFTRFFLLLYIKSFDGGSKGRMSELLEKSTFRQILYWGTI